MVSIFLKEFGSYFSSVVGYVIIAVFLVLMGLFVWVFKDSSILENHYASLDALFSIAPAVLIFLVPAVTMKSFSEEFQTGTIEILGTKPIKNYEILYGKYFASLAIVLFAILPTLIYFWSVYRLGSPMGNLDVGGIIGSYIGLFLLAASFVAIGIFSSLLSNNQIVAFLVAATLCFLLHWSFEFVSQLPIFYGRIDNVIEELGMNYHYASLSKGLIKSTDVIYFLSVIMAFFLFSGHALKMKKN